MYHYHLVPAISNNYTSQKIWQHVKDHPFGELYLLSRLLPQLINSLSWLQLVINNCSCTTSVKFQIFKTFVTLKLIFSLHFMTPCIQSTIHVGCKMVDWHLRVWLLRQDWWHVLFLLKDFQFLSVSLIPIYFEVTWHAKNSKIFVWRKEKWWCHSWALTSFWAIIQMDGLAKCPLQLTNRLCSCQK